MTTPTQKLANSITGAGREAIQERTQHTPGPWEWQVSQNGAASFIEIIAEGWGIAHVYGSEKLIECQANARLIAASPELLEACKAMALVGTWGKSSPILAQAHTAIARAEGRAQ